MARKNRRHHSYDGVDPRPLENSDFKELKNLRNAIYEKKPKILEALGPLKQIWMDILEFSVVFTGQKDDNNGEVKNSIIGYLLACKTKENKITILDVALLFEVRNMGFCEKIFDHFVNDIKNKFNRYNGRVFIELTVTKEIFILLKNHEANLESIGLIYQDDKEKTIENFFGHGENGYYRVYTIRETRV